MSSNQGNPNDQGTNDPAKSKESRNSYPSSRLVSCDTDGGIPTPTTIDSNSQSMMRSGGIDSPASVGWFGGMGFLGGRLGGGLGGSTSRGAGSRGAGSRPGGSHGAGIRGTTHTTTRRVTISSEIVPIVERAGDRLEMTARENQLLKEHIKALREELENQGEMSRRVASINEHCSRLLDRNAQLELKVAQVQEPLLDQIRDLGSRVREADKKATRAESEAESLKRQCERQTEQERRIEEERRRLESEYDRISQKLEEHERNSVEGAGEIRALRAKLEALSDECQELREAQRQHFTGLSKTSSEMARLLKENDRLQTLLRESTKDSMPVPGGASPEEAQELRQKVDSLTNDLQDVSQRFAASEAHCTALENKLKELEDNEKERIDDALQGANERYQALEDAYQRDTEQFNQQMQLTKDKLAALHNVHDTAQKVMARNTELERKVHQHSLAKDEIMRLREELNQSESMRLEAVNEARTFKSQKTVLESSVKNLEKELEALRSRVLNQASQSPQSGAGSPATERAMKAMLDRTTAEHEAELKAVTEKYERVVKDLRTAHAQELRKLDIDNRNNLRDLEKSKIAEVERAGREALQKVAAEHAKELETLRQKYETSFESYANSMKQQTQRLVDEQRQTWQTRINRKEQETESLRQEYEEQLRQLEKEKDVLIREAAEEMDSRMAAKDRECSSLIAELVALKVQRFETSSDLPAITKKFEDEIRILTQQLTQSREEMKQARMDAEGELRELNDAKTAEIAELRRQLDDAVRASVTRQVDTAKQFQDALAPAISEATRDLNAKFHKLREDYLHAMKNLSDAETSKRTAELTVAKLQADSTHNKETIEMLKRQLEEMNVAAEEGAKENGTGSTAATEAVSALKQQMDSLIERNKHLEETIATISQKYHDDLREHLSTVRKLKDDLSKANRGPVGSKLSASRDITPRRALQESRELRRELDSTLDKLREAERKNTQLTQNLNLREAEVQALRAHYTGPALSSAENKALLQKLERLQRSADEGLAQQARAAQLAKEAADARETRVKLGYQIDFLRRESDERQERTKHLEAQLRNLRASPDADNSSLEITINELRIEREGMSRTCRDLEERLKAYEGLLKEEMGMREEQVREMEAHKKEMARCLARNSQVEKELEEALKRARMGDIGTPGTDQSTLFFQKLREEIVDKTTQHEIEDKNLTSALERSEAELNELREQLRAHKEAAARQKEMENENSVLRDTTEKLERELAHTQRELEVSKEFDATRLGDLVNGLSERLADHQRLLAKVQDDNQKELQAITEALEKSRSKNDNLQRSTELAAQEISERERELKELYSAINDVLGLAGRSGAGSGTGSGAGSGAGAASGELKEAFNDLLTRITQQDKRMKRAMDELQRLLGNQEEELQKANQTRKDMSQLLADETDDNTQHAKDIKEKSQEIQSQIDDLSAQYKLIDSLKNRASASHTGLSRVEAFILDFMNSNDDFAPLEQSIEHARRLAQLNSDELETLMGQAQGASRMADDLKSGLPGMVDMARSLSSRVVSRFSESIGVKRTRHETTTSEAPGATTVGTETSTDVDDQTEKRIRTETRTSSISRTPPGRYL